MSIGAKVRRMFGRHERLVSELWRAGFIDLNAFFRQVRAWVPGASNVLEIGCGEGAGTERLADLYPHASILSIDVAPNLGRLYARPPKRVSFQQVSVTDLAATHGGKFDLILMCDVLHHIPAELRAEIIAATRSLLAPGGSFVCKDWARAATPIHWLAYAADRWLTGDRVQFLTRCETEILFENAFSASAQRGTATIKPWRNNFALLIQPAQ
jgi:2-polyprenyl-3-methyl-5-hydroxy-6-metoxy-1,4-benzoquinol methylase